MVTPKGPIAPLPLLTQPLLIPSVMNQLIRFVLLLFIIPAAYAQQTRQLSGQVKDKATGETLPGVSVVLKGTTVRYHHRCYGQLHASHSRPE